MNSPFAPSFLTLENLLCIIALLVALLALVVLVTFLQRLFNNRVERDMKTFIPEFEKLFEAASRDAADTARIRADLPPERFKYFERFLRLKASALSEDLDVAPIRAVAHAAGFSATLRKRAQKSRGWKQALALRTLSYLRDCEDIPLFRETLRKSRFYPALYAASLGLGLTRDSESLDLILKRLFRPERPNRDALLTVLEAYGAAACPRLTRFLVDSGTPTMVRTALIDFLRIRGYHPARPVMEQLVRDPGAREVLIHAVEALGLVGNEESVACVEPLISSPDTAVRLKAVVALAQLTGCRALPHLEKSLDDPDWWVRRNAAEALCSVGEAGVAALTRRAEQPSDPAGRMACTVLSEDRHDRLRWRYRFDGICR